MFYVKDKQVQMMVVIHVDDMIISGEKNIIKDFKEDFKENYMISDLGRLSMHLGIKYDWKVNQLGEKILIAYMDKYSG